MVRAATHTLNVLSTLWYLNQRRKVLLLLLADDAELAVSVATAGKHKPGEGDKATVLRPTREVLDLVELFIVELKEQLVRAALWHLHWSNGSAVIPAPDEHLVVVVQRDRMIVTTLDLLRNQAFDQRWLVRVRQLLLGQTNTELAVLI